MTCDESFDYSDDEWRQIDAAVRKVRAASPSPLERASLIRAGLKYRRDLAQRRRGDYLAPRARAKSWAKVGKLCAQLRKALETAGRNRYGEAWRENAFCILPEDLARELAEGLRPLSGHYAFRGDRVLSLGHVFELLAAIGKDANQLSKPFYWGLSGYVSFTGRQDPQIIYFQRVLWIWTDVFGGKLRFSRNPQSGTLSGPLIHYITALTLPLMGDAAPAFNSLPDIIRRQRSFYRWLDAYSAECGDNRAEIATTRLLGISWHTQPPEHMTDSLLGEMGRVLHSIAQRPAESNGEM